jgi:transcriptional accessory protein Tex/SPT6
MKEGEILDVYVKQVDFSQKRVHLKAVNEEEYES